MWFCWGEKWAVSDTCCVMYPYVCCTPVCVCVYCVWVQRCPVCGGDPVLCVTDRQTDRHLLREKSRETESAVVAAPALASQGIPASEGGTTLVRLNLNVRLSGCCADN